MIRKLDDVDPSNYQRSFVMEFIQTTSPFTVNNPRLTYLIEQFLDNNMETPITISMNETIKDPVTNENEIKFFMLWLNNRKLYTGTSFIKESEVSNGIHLGNYELED